MIIIREIKLEDLESFRFWNLPDKSHHKFNGPYFKQGTIAELDERVNRMRDNLLSGKKAHNSMKAIADSETDTLIGTVSRYFKSIETDWMEIGLVVFNEDYWGKGIGYKALKLWIDDVFEVYPHFVRIGLTTWSGNERMMKLAEKLGMINEATYRKARIVDGQYYDSVSYGILKEEWTDNRQEML